MDRSNIQKLIITITLITVFWYTSWSLMDLFSEHFIKNILGDKTIHRVVYYFILAGISVFLLLRLNESSMLVW